MILIYKTKTVDFYLALKGNNKLVYIIKNVNQNIYLFFNPSF